MTREFVDYYELLEVSSNANTETIERVFRYFAQKYHPDVSSDNDPKYFNKLVEAYTTLRQPESRAAYDVKYRGHQQSKSDLVSGAQSTEADCDDRHRLLTILYAQRRRNMSQPGVGIMTLEQIMGCPLELLEFHLWYFREKGWIDREEDGMLAITAMGVDEIECRSKAWKPNEPLVTYAPDARTASGSSVPNQPNLVPVQS